MARITRYSVHELVWEFPVTGPQVLEWLESGALRGEKVKLEAAPSETREGWGSPAPAPDRFEWRLPILELAVLHELIDGKDPEEARLVLKSEEERLRERAKVDLDAPIRETSSEREERENARETALYRKLVANTKLCTGADCEASIVWATSDKGARMPLDNGRAAEPGPNQYELVLDGNLLRARYVTKEMQNQGITGYTNHYATCPNARDFRRVT